MSNNYRMKYYRLSFRSQDRLSGSTYANPKFTIDLPSNAFGNTRSGTCKMVLEQFDGYGAKQTSKAYDQVCVSFKNYTIQNAIQTIGENDYTNSKGIGFVKADRRGSSEIYYHFERDYGNINNAMVIPCATFSNNILEFDLKHIDGTTFLEASATEFKFYTFCLGIYVEDDE